MSAPKNTPVLPTWTVTGQRETQRQMPNGTWGSGLEVSYQTGTGITGTVWVPDASISPANVAKAITDALGPRQAINDLAG